MSGHYLKGSARSYRPGRLVCVHCRTAVPAGRDVPYTHTPLAFHSAAVAYSDRTPTGYTNARTIHFGTADSFWQWLELHRKGRRRTYCFAPVASDALTVMGFWDRLDSMGARWLRGGPDQRTADANQGADTGYTIRTKILRGRPDVIDYSIHGRPFLWMSLRQFIDVDTEELALATGFKWPGEDPADYSGTHPPRTAADLARLYLHAVETYAAWWESLAAGQFPRSTPAAAGQFLRSRVPKNMLVTHECPGAQELEGLAAHAGRATVWYYGHVTPQGKATPRKRLPFPASKYPPTRGPIHHWDFRSMYPSLLRMKEFPVSLSHYKANETVGGLTAALVHFAAIAHVTLRTSRPEYPHRDGGRVVYPVGEFIATLTTPELAAALAAGEVVTVHRAAYYYRGRPYQRAAEELLEMRSKYRADGNLGWEMMVKLLANSMTGKLNQKPGRWVPCPGVWAVQPWGEWYYADRATGETTRRRAQAGLVEELTRDVPAQGTLAAGYAHLTAYGRCLMRRIRELLPERSVFQQDTDGVWVTSTASDILSEVVSTLSKECMSLRLTGTTTFARFYGPKHYYHDGGWVASGLCDPRFGPGSTFYQSYHFLNACRGSSDGPPREIVKVDDSGTLDPEPAGCHVGPDGWASPLHYGPPGTVTGGGVGNGGGGGGLGGLFPD